MLHEFPSSNREELINRCRAIVSERSSPPASATEAQYAALLLLTQLVEALRHAQVSPSPQVDHAVHDFGDICQAIAELAYEIKAPVAVDEPLGLVDAFWPKPAAYPAPWWVERYAPIEDEE